MSENNNAQPISTSDAEPKPGQPEGTGGDYVTVEGCEPLPRTADGKSVDWEAAGWEVMVYDDDGNVLKVADSDGTYVGFVWLRATDPEKVVRYLGKGRLLAAFNGNGSKVMQQATGRAYLSWLKSQKSPTGARLDTHETSGVLKPFYREVLLQKLWARLAGIQLEKRQGGPRVVEKIVEVKVVSLPDGTQFKADTSSEEPLTSQLRSAWIEALMREDEDLDPMDAVAKGERLYQKGRFHELLGLEKPAEPQEA